MGKAARCQTGSLTGGSPSLVWENPLQKRRRITMPEDAEQLLTYRGEALDTSPPRGAEGDLECSRRPGGAAQAHGPRRLPLPSGLPRPGRGHGRADVGAFPALRKRHDRPLPSAGGGGVEAGSRKRILTRARQGQPGTGQGRVQRADDRILRGLPRRPGAAFRLHLVPRQGPEQPQRHPPPLRHRVHGARHPESLHLLDPVAGHPLRHGGPDGSRGLSLAEGDPRRIRPHRRRCLLR